MINLRVNDLKKFLRWRDDIHPLSFQNGVCVAYQFHGVAILVLHLHGSFVRSGNEFA